MTLCERCSKNEEYCTCSECNQHSCMICFNMVHFGINAQELAVLCITSVRGKIYATNVKGRVCGKCTVILSWAPAMNYLVAVNRVSELIKTNIIDSKIRNENYYKANFGSHATQVIMDAVDSSKR
jgi:hypothetical protein